jgi:ABC-type Mn2+/Zn2+ transport system ATPase subunit
MAEVRRRVDFLRQVGLDYLSLARGADTLSGGEAQRIRLAAQLGSALQGVLYVLDEPSIGLHARDHSQLLGALQRLRDGGNTVVVVEHVEATLRAADHIIDVGPPARVATAAASSRRAHPTKWRARTRRRDASCAASSRCPLRRNAAAATARSSRSAAHAPST